jgi:hypothetical protein
MRWSFPRLILLALGGVIPFLSFFLEVRVAREVRSYLASRADRVASPSSAALSSNSVEASH